MDSRRHVLRVERQHFAGSRDQRVAFVVRPCDRLYRVARRQEDGAQQHDAPFARIEEPHVRRPPRGSRRPFPSSAQRRGSPGAVLAGPQAASMQQREGREQSGQSYRGLEWRMTSTVPDTLIPADVHLSFTFADCYGRRTEPPMLNLSFALHRTTARRAGSHRGPPAHRIAAAAARRAAAVDTDARRQPPDQPLHRRRGLRSAGRLRPRRIAPRLRLLRHDTGGARNRRRAQRRPRARGRSREPDCRSRQRRRPRRVHGQEALRRRLPPQRLAGGIGHSPARTAGGCQRHRGHGFRNRARLSAAARLHRTANRRARHRRSGVAGVVDRGRHAGVRPVDPLSARHPAMRCSSTTPATTTCSAI